MYELFMMYVGSSWFLGNEQGPIIVLGPITCLAMLYMVKLYLSMDSLKKSNFYSFLYSFIGCILLLAILYGYIAVVLCFFWIMHVKQITIERIKYYYIRNLYGHLGRWHESSNLDELLDYDKLIDETSFDKQKMKDFYSSDIPVWAGFVIAILIVLLCGIVYDGYKFFPNVFC